MANRSASQFVGDEEMEFSMEKQFHRRSNTLSTDVKHHHHHHHHQQQQQQQNRKSKDRSVYGQPKIVEEFTVQQQLQHTNPWKSLDSLIYCDSNQSFGSNSTSCSDLRSSFDQSRLNNNQPGNGATDLAMVSDLGTSVESFDNENETGSNLKRCSSIQSTSSGCSVNNDGTDEFLIETKYFLKRFVEKIFDDCTAISLEEKSRFGQLAQNNYARLWFARYINKKRIECKCVTESTFFSLAQYFALILFECAESDDFGPAKILMNMCFTYYYEPTYKLIDGRNLQNPNDNHHHHNNNRNENHRQQQDRKQYLCLILRDQPIWKMVRFWNAAFFDAVLNERSNYYDCDRSRDPSTRFYDWQFHANLTFGQLG